MNKLITFCILLLVFGSASAQKNETVKKPDIYFSEPLFDFGNIESNKPVQHDFVFFNSGTAPLLLKEVKAACGCTVPTWPRQPIKPGENAKISVTFDPKDDAGKVFNKSIKVTTNIKEDDHDKVVVINIKGKVNAAPATK
jgi:hypothetical protein